MAIYTGQVVVTGTAVQIDGSSETPVRMHIHNNDNTDGIFLGGEGVTATTGLHLMKLDSLEIILNPNEKIYAISAGGNVDMSWMKQVY